MTRHDTPNDVAIALAEWAPRVLRTVLDPSVGGGALLAPLLARPGQPPSRVVAIDKDRQAIKTVRDRFSGYSGVSLCLTRTDFLRWMPRAAAIPDEGFDCVVMNPPFDGRTKVPVQIHGDGGTVSSRPNHVPLEGAFLLRAVCLTRPRGRVLAILPGSIVSAESGERLRWHLLRSGGILCVHELPNYTFPNVESRVYLLVYEKGGGQNTVLLRGDSLSKPARLVVSRADLGTRARLDFEYQAAVRWHSLLHVRNPQAGWSPLANHAEIKRGNGVRSTQGGRRPVHSTDFRGGFWSPAPGPTVPRAPGGEAVHPTDLLLRRVGRDCAGSVGAVLGTAGSWTDCVLRLRPKPQRHRDRLLFALRALFASELGRRLVQLGTGAAYISASALSQLLIPANLADVFPQTFAAYRAAVRARRYATMVELEFEAIHQLTSLRAAA